MLGSVIPSSRFLVRRALREVDWSQARVVVEYGPGVGTFTGELLKRMTPDAKLLAFETQDDFVRHLQDEIPDPRLEVVHDSAGAAARVLEERGAGPADYVLSGIPFSLMPPDERDAILQNTREMLAPNGTFLVYQFSPTIKKPLQKAFGRVDSEFESRNIPPARVYRCRP